MEEKVCDLGVEGEKRKEEIGQSVEEELVLSRERGRRLWERKHMEMTPPQDGVLGPALTPGASEDSNSLGKKQAKVCSPKQLCMTYQETC